MLSQWCSHTDIHVHTYKTTNKNFHMLMKYSFGSAAIPKRKGREMFEGVLRRNMGDCKKNQPTRCLKS